MKTIFTTIFSMLITTFLCAQAPQGIPYQAVMRNADGSVMASSAVSLTFMIHDATATGTVVYQESHSLTSNAQGLVSCVVGGGVVSQGNFADINWGSGAKFLQVMMGSGVAQVDLGTLQMLSVPYALHSASADNATNAINATNAETAANGFSNVSTTGDTLYMANGNFIIVPGISAANYPAPVLGCTNSQACNFNAAATQDDGTCLVQGATCDDGNSSTSNDLIYANCQCVGTSCASQSVSVTSCYGQTSLTYDGRTYDLVEIGGQCWFADNLATDQYRNGDLIPTGLDNATWQNTTIGAYTINNNDPENDITYGKLYNWFTTVDVRGLCPTGWHVPTDCEWMYLEGSLGMTVQHQEKFGSNFDVFRGENEASALKSIIYWSSPNLGATNSSGFTALPGGGCSYVGEYINPGEIGVWWTSSQVSENSAWFRRIYYSSERIERNQSISKRSGVSVRCVRD